MPCVVRLAWALTASLAAAVNLRSLSFGGGRHDLPTRRHDLLTRPARTNVSQPDVLPSGIVPKRYEIHLELDPSKSVYRGEETITVDFVEDGITEVVLNANKLQIESATFLFPYEDNVSNPASPPGRRTMGPSFIHHDVHSSRVVVTFPFVMPRGEGAIYIRFYGKISDEMSGLYRSVYTDVLGNPKALLSTQMEPISARRVFPCWDEPAWKAVFKLSVTVPRPLQAIGNAPVESSVAIDAQTKRVTFADTAVMSTYLLALVLGEFDYVEATTWHGVRVRVYTPVGRSREGQFALGVAAKVLDRFDDYFDVRFPLPKLDLVSIPKFSAGAMENWGLITFRESLVLIDENTASAQQKQDVGIVTAHELAHQWFGNHVTMAWWDDLWLNEAFATWMEYCGLAEIYPEYDLWSQFSIGVLEEGLRYDELVNSHPIHVPINHADEVSEVFDAITYKKGAAVINMLYSYIGAESFQKGLRVYLKRHAYSNAKTTDLWNIWSEVTGLPIAEIMTGWTEQQNFPYVRVTSVGRDGGTGEAIIEVEQRSFVDQPTGEEDKLWKIPITASSVGGEAAPITVLMSTKTMQVRVPQPDAYVAVHVNVGRPSPIRVMYGQVMELSLGYAVRSKDLPPADRATLLYDNYRLMRAGKVSFQQLTDLLEKYRDEDSYVVWAALHDVLIGVDRFMGVGEFLVDGFWKVWVYELLGYGWKAAGVGWQSPGDELHVTELLRGVMIDLHAKLRGNGLLEEAQRRYALYVSSKTATDAAAAIPNAIRTSVLQLVLKRGGRAEYDQIVSMYNRSSSVAQEHILRAIGYASSDELKLAAMQWAISGEVNTQDAHYVFKGVSESSPEGLNVAWAFLKEHVVELSKTLPTPLLNKIITYSTSGFCTHQQEEEVVSFLGTLDLPGSERTVAIATEMISHDAKVLVPLRGAAYAFPVLMFPADAPPADGDQPK